MSRPRPAMPRRPAAPTWWWLSWYARVDLEHFEYHGPWWISGEDMDGDKIVCAAVVAPSDKAAARVILNAYDEGRRPKHLDLRFAEAHDGGNPFNDRFRRAKWMKWPWPEAA